MAITIRAVEKLTDTQLDEIADLFERAFAGDLGYESTKATLTDELRRESNMVLIRSVQLNGTFFFAANGGNIIGVLLALGPGKGMNRTAEERALTGRDAYQAQESPEFREWWKKYREVEASLRKDVITDERVLNDSWYVSVMATEPSYQGKGIGTKLLSAVREKARTDGAFVTLFALKESNISWYTKQGFDLRKRLDCPAFPSLGEGLTFPFAFFTWDEPSTSRPTQ
ncbi:hypothetical protein CYLTODRAFT_494792 [Cylindrobasidium torrendii FP15055 ss-10]|uniref:N-acetyltransferase domain-containing protein n=1 Tax=Cylindrobasidium torrendii FP15055 ss-10 TaxID=1314674 RepID=A0A0D7AW54_9AGAR|nr:hypothetical protein CYLTODRAFT_494792 [Cylindrobasidium torrendii FP15055 ss-10]